MTARKAMQARLNTTDRTRAVTILASLLVAFTHAEPTPPWTEVDCDRRIVCFAPEASGSFLVTVPWRAADGALGIRPRDPRGRAMPARIVFQDDTTAAVLMVDPSSRRVPRTPVCGTLYYGSNLAPDTLPVEPPDADETAANTNADTTVADDAARSPSADPRADPLPVVVELVRVPGSSVPDTWDRMLYMFGNAPGRSVRLELPRIAPMDLAPKLERLDSDVPKERRRPPTAGRNIARFHTWMLCPETGTYRFALNAEGIAYLLVDGRQVAEAPFGSRFGGWHGGAAVGLTAGLHRLELFGLVNRHVRHAIGWIPPSAPANTPFAEVPADRCLSAWKAEGRAERIDRVLHPDFQFSTDRPYEFRGCDTRFHPVMLIDNSADWCAQALFATWEVDGVALAPTGSRFRHVFTNDATPMVTLHVRDTLGFEASCTKAIDLRRRVPLHFAVDAEVINLPATGYPEDVLQPVLRVTGNLPPAATLDIDWQVRRRAGATDSNQIVITALGNRPSDTRLGRFQAGDLTAIDWRVSHCGVVIRQGRARFCHPPFESVPVAADGLALLDGDGNRLVLVPHRFANPHVQPPLTQEQVFGDILGLDDMLIRHSRRRGDRRSVFERTLERLVDGPDHPTVTMLAPPDDAQTGVHAPLMTLVRAPDWIASHRHADLIVLSLALGDILAFRDADAFERQAATLTDLVGTALRKPMVWVTPPPYAPHRAALRPYAAAIQRIADARGIPVADLYSAFFGLSVSPFVTGYDLELTPEAEDLAAQIVARAMLSDPSQPKHHIRDLIRW